MEMPLSPAQFDQATPAQSITVAARDVERELLKRALGNPFLLRIPVLVPLLVIAVAAADAPNPGYLWWLVAAQILVGCFTASTAYRVKRAIQNKQQRIRTLAIQWLSCETISGIVWGLMMVPIVEAGNSGLAIMIIQITITVTLTAAAISAASANGLVQALLSGFMLITLPATVLYYDQVGLYGVLCVALFPPTLLWLGMLSRRQSRDALKVEMENETLSAQLTESLRISQYLAKRDNLTGLLNRNEFKRVTEELHRQNRGSGIALIAIDLDNFKQINDDHGHAVGDQALVAATGLMQSEVRAHDVSADSDETIARWGGEEFIIALANCTAEQASIVAERIRAAFENHSDRNWPDGLKMTGSFGVTNWNNGDTIDQVIGRADKAMYRAKEMGRNRVNLEKLELV